MFQTPLLPPCVLYNLRIPTPVRERAAHFDRKSLPPSSHINRIFETRGKGKIGEGGEGGRGEEEGKNLRVLPTAAGGRR